MENFDSFKNIIKSKLNAYIEGSKNPFLSLDFKNIRLIKTPRSDYIPNIEKIEYSDHVALTRLTRAIHEMFYIVMRMFEAGEKHKEIYEIIYSYPDISEQDYKDFSYLKENGFFILDENENLRNLPVNLDEAYIKKFLNELISKAIKIRDNKDGVQNANNSRFFMLGDKGVGKTAFLNNIFSRYPNIFKKKEACWIRVDLTKSHLGERKLLGALDFQLAKIFREHYFGNFSKEERDDFELKLSFNFYKDGILNERKFKTIYEDFESLFKEDRTEDFDKDIITGIKRYVEQKYGLIYIFDGLDKIDDNNDLFKKKMVEIKSILTNEKFKGVFVFVMRHESHRDYLSYNDDAHLRNSNKMFYIVPPKLDEIINKRIDLLFLHKDKNFNEIKDRLIYDLEGDTDEKEIKKVFEKLSNFTRNDYEAYLNVFLLFLYKGITKDENEIDDIIENWKKKETFTELKCLFGYNYRHLLNIIQSANKKFLEAVERIKLPIDDILSIGNDILNNKLYVKSKEDLNKLLKKTYLITDFLLLGDNIFFENPDTYEYSSDGEILSKYNKKKRPCLYNLYYCINVKNVEEEKYYLLIKIRILQYISIKKEIYSTKETKNDIADFFYNTFNYSNTHTIVAFEELRERGLIIEVMQKDGNCVFQLSRVGKHHLNTLIYDFTYINLIIDDILIPESFQDKFIVESNNEEKKTANRFIQQYPRMINFISMLYAFEQKELENSHIEGKEKANWVIFNKIYEKFIDTTAKVLKIYDKDLKYFDKTLLRNNIL